MQIRFLNPNSEIPNPKSGFTVIELLVVVTIIAILMSIVISIVGAFLTQARDASTKSTLGKVQGLANQRAMALNRLLLRRGAVTTTDATQKVLASKQVQIRFFPQRIAELSASDQPALYAAYQNQFSIQNLALYDPTQDPKANLRSSEILYNFLTQANVLGDAPVSTDAFSASEVQDTDNNGLPEFVDAWGQPLRFYRWPTRFFRSRGLQSKGQPVGQPAPITYSKPLINPPNANPSNADGTYDVDNAKLLFASLPVFSGNLANDLDRDPDDPLRVCVNNANFTSQVFEQNYHTPATYHTLLIISPGPDGDLGIYEPYFIDIQNDIFGNLAQPIPYKQDALTDNIMFLNVRAGGK